MFFGASRWARRLIAAPIAKAAPPTEANTRPNTLVETQVRQALQQTVAIGACSPYLLVAWITRPCQTAFTARSVLG